MLPWAPPPPPIEDIAKSAPRLGDTPLQAWARTRLVRRSMEIQVDGTLVITKWCKDDLTGVTVKITETIK